MTKLFALTGLAQLRSSLAGMALLIACLALPAAAAGAALEVIPLKYRTADQVIPVLKPLLDPHGSISGIQNQLFIRTTPRNLTELKRVLATLDVVPRRLVITVRQDADASRDRTGAGLSARIGSGDAAVMQGGGARTGELTVRRGDDVLRGRVDNTRSLDADRNTQTLQVLEGSSAYIRVGQSIALPQRHVVRTVIDGRVVERVVDTGIEYRDVVGGFYALPRVSGDRVTLEISPQRDSLPGPEQNLPAGSVNVQRVVTTVAGRLGEWIEVGGVAQAGSTDQTAILGSTRDTSWENRRILLKVDEIR